MALGDMPYAPSKHNGLVITAHFTGNKLLKSPEIPCQIGPPELVVERRAANGAFQHNLQGRCDTRWFAIGVTLLRLLVHFPRLNKSGNVQIGNRETAKSSPGFSAC